MRPCESLGALQKWIFRDKDLLNKFGVENPIGVVLDDNNDLWVIDKSSTTPRGPVKTATDIDKFHGVWPAPSWRVNTREREAELNPTG